MFFCAGQLGRRNLTPDHHSIMRGRRRRVTRRMWVGHQNRVRILTRLKRLTPNAKQAKAKEHTRKTTRQNSGESSKPTINTERELARLAGRILFA